MHYNTHIDYATGLIAVMVVGSTISMSTCNGWCSVVRAHDKFVVTTDKFTYFTRTPFQSARRLFL